MTNARYSGAPAPVQNDPQGHRATREDHLPVPDLEEILRDPRLTALLFAKSAMVPMLRALADADAPDLEIDGRDLLARIAARLNIQHREKFGRAA